MGLVRDATGSFALGLLTIATGSVGGIVVLAVGHDRRLEQTETSLTAEQRAGALGESV
jgi:hypothetical protein